LAGAALALGAPLGLLIIEALFARVMPVPAWVLARLESELTVYAYLTLSTTVVFSAFGWIIGKKSDRLDAMSLTDTLTELGNRRQLDRHVHAELARAGRYRTPLALLLIDVDRLKDINDRGGHQAGDRALRRVAEAIARTARKTDIPARFGGDEFALLAPQTSADDAFLLAERIRENVGSDATGELSVSIGLADLSHAPSLDPEELYRAADRALYLSKSSGRNRVSLPSKPVELLPRLVESPAEDSVGAASASLQSKSERSRGSRKSPSGAK
jgi:diguanylate cyclase (GGDEF)-like protein